MLLLAGARWNAFCQSFIASCQISGLRFDHSEIRCSIDQARIQGKSFLVKFAGVLGRSSALFRISKRGEKSGIVRELLHGFGKQFSRLRLGH